MKLTIDGHAVDAAPGQSLLDLVRAHGLDAPRLSRRPIAARIAGETYTLNYIPNRADAPVRAAVEASGGSVHLVRFPEPRARRAYERTALFVLHLAIFRLFPEAVSKTNYAVGNAMNVTVEKTPAFTEADLAALRREFRALVEADIPLIRTRLTTAQAAEQFAKIGQADKARLLRWRKTPYFDVYRYGDFQEYFYGEMAPSTGYLTVWDMVYATGGLMFLYPDPQDPDRPCTYRELPNFTAAFREAERWCTLMDCAVAPDLNELVSSGRIRVLIRVNEALHEKRFSEIADRIVDRGAQAVFLAGPSSSGKTTSANRLSVQLRVHGKRPIPISLDDYYEDRDKVPVGPDGKVDLEHINTIQVARFHRDLAALLRGETVELPRFDFITQRSSPSGRFVTLGPDSVLVVEGLHGLNPAILPEDLDPNKIFRVYVSALFPLNLDNHNRIATTYLRLLRRIVRDNATRGYSVEATLDIWDSVRRGEERWIFPYQENADVIFNSSLVYELAVLKKHIYPLLTAVGPDNAHYEEVRSIVKVLNYIEEADVDDEIPPTSILREFIGGNTFYKK